MKTFKDILAPQIVRLLQCGGLVLGLVCTMSLSIQAQILNGSDLFLTDPSPEIKFFDNVANAEFNWEVEGFSERFEISENGSLDGTGFFKILPDAREDALTLVGDSVIIGGEVDSAQQLSIVGVNSFSGMEFVLPDSDTVASILLNDIINSFYNFR